MRIQPAAVIPPPVAPAGQNCVGARKCSEFGTQREAQAYFDACGKPGRMDSNHDGVPCESLP
jgi:hypothetical protein